MVFFSAWVFVLIVFSYYDASYTGCMPTLWTHFTLTASLKILPPNIVTFWGLGNRTLMHTFFRGEGTIQPVTWGISSLCIFSLYTELPYQVLDPKHPPLFGSFLPKLLPFGIATCFDSSIQFNEDFLKYLYKRSFRVTSLKIAEQKTQLTQCLRGIKLSDSILLKFWNLIKNYNH